MNRRCFFQTAVGAATVAVIKPTLPPTAAMPTTVPSVPIVTSGYANTGWNNVMTSSYATTTLNASGSFIYFTYPR